MKDFDFDNVVIPWGELGYITYKRTYARRTHENTEKTEEYIQTIDRCLKACDEQLFVNFNEEERKEFKNYLLKLKCCFAGRFLWQLGTKTVDTLGLLSLQNCAFTIIDDPIKPFIWAMDALMLGSGVGYNLQREYVYQLPKPKKAKVIRNDSKDADFIVPDSRAGWIELLKRTLEAHFVTGENFSYSTVCIREKGKPIKGFGGVAAGAEELCWGMTEISKILNGRANKKVRPIDCLDIMNIIGMIVVSGNVRRSAQIAIGDMDDLQFLNAKNWQDGNIPNWRAMSNNSVVCNDFSKLPPQFWNNYNGQGERYGLINLQNSRKMGRIGDFRFPDPNVNGYNPCVTGDTEILTDNGYFRIDSLVGQDVNIWNGFEWSNVTPKVTGKNQELVTVSFSDGRKLTCTKYHTFHTAVGYTGKSKSIKAIDLLPGDKLIKHEFPIIEHGPDLEDAYTQGFVAADGMELNKTIYLYPPKYKCLDRLENVKAVSDEINNKRKRVTLNKTPVSKRFVPVKYNLKSKIDWLSGLFDGDGTELKEGGLQIVSVNKLFLEDVQKLLSTIGIQSKLTLGNIAGNRIMPDGRGGSREFSCQETNRICIGATQMQSLKKLGLKCERMEFKKSPQRDASQFTTVLEVVESGIADEVYCFNEPKRHLGIFNGILTGQCAEQSLEDKETCCLAEVFLPNIESYEEFAKILKYLYRVNKHSLALKCHLKETEAVVHKNMRMGIGVTGYLQSTQEQKDWLKLGYEELRQFDKEYSAKHNFPESIKLTTVKPSGTLSLLAGVTPGAHPGFSEYYLRRIRIASNSSLVEVCRKSGYDVEYQKQFDGSDDRNTVVVSFPCKFPSHTKFAEEMSAVDQLNVVKELQTNWSDNAVSVTVYYKVDEIEAIQQWLKENYNNCIKSISFLLHSDHGFVQAPLEKITKEIYENYKAKTKPITSAEVKETDVLDNSECSSGVCPIK